MDARRHRWGMFRVAESRPLHAVPRRPGSSTRAPAHCPLRATFDDSVWSHLAGTLSEPFALGERRRVAVKVIDERGNELMRVLDVAE